MGNSILQNKSFIILLLAKFISSVGTFVQSMAFALFVIDKTQSSLLFATVLMTALVPRVLLSPFCGVIIDWLDRKKLLVTLDLISGGLLVAIVLLFGSGEISMSVIYGVAFALGIMSSFDEPIVMTLIPSLFKDSKEINAANSLNMIVLALGNLIGPFLGVFIYTNYGIVATLLVNGVSFLFAALIQMFIVISTDNVSDEKRTVSKFRSDFVEGIRYIWSNNRMKTILLCIIIQNCFFNGATQVGIPFVSRVDLQVSNTQFALIEIVVILGVIFGAVISGGIQKKLNIDRLFVVMISIIGISFLGISIVTFGILNSVQITFYLILGFYLVLGISSINVSIAFQSEMQKEIDNKYLGRISSIALALIMASVPIGQGIYGWLFEMLPSSVPFIISAVFIILIAVSYGQFINKNQTRSRGSIHETTL
ncbi:MFS transporter [Bacillus atrophaeus]|uniref:MFS transporter n=1 Tax=Bacillus atrophaeus TaxID=1452 RepID=UPI002281C800|nr:MFS transporter [Bacillus atrophaeus]MCY8823362.1 MFS transporter [Bacillus atrophaeus]MCY8841545.1 MFS transporter [Bacillus atrophaeus]MEC0805801.1 MFS transporter [Bacillus atrophaeus]MEC0853716.1 MFS transporter [Bacillus atrophaeus]MEC0856843.1 MFS transporter [Bacillus atrophaeus]